MVSVKIKKHLLRCVTKISLRLTVKVDEEELIPRGGGFIKHYGSGYSLSEPLRVELAILDTLHWDLSSGTPLDFSALFHSLVALGWPRVQGSPWRHPSLQAASLTRQLKPRVPGHQLVKVQGLHTDLGHHHFRTGQAHARCYAPASGLLKKAL